MPWEPGHSHPSCADPAVSAGDRASPSSPWTAGSSPKCGPRRCRRSRPVSWPGGMPRCWRSWDPGSRLGSHLVALRLVREFREVRVWSPRHVARVRRAIRGARGRPRRRRRCAGPTRSSWRPGRRRRCCAGMAVAGGARERGGRVRAGWRELDDETIRRRGSTSTRARPPPSSRAMCSPRNARRGDRRGVRRLTRAPRVWPSEITLFKSLGLAVEDVTAARLVYRKASEPHLS